MNASKQTPYDSGQKHRRRVSGLCPNGFMVDLTEYLRYERPFRHEYPYLIRLLLNTLPLVVALIAVWIVASANQRQRDWRTWFQTHSSDDCPPDVEGFVHNNLIASPDLKKFFVEWNVTNLAKLAVPLKKNPPVSDGDKKAVEYIILERSENDLQALSNLLMYPEFMTDRTRVRTILIGLTSSLQYYRLATTVGLIGKDLERLTTSLGERTAIVQRLLGNALEAQPWSTPFNWTLSEATWKAVLPSLRPSDGPHVVDFLKAAYFRHISKRVYEPIVEWFLKTFPSASDARAAVDAAPSLRELSPKDRMAVIGFIQSYVTSGRVGYGYTSGKKALYIPSLCEVFGRNFNLIERDW